MTPDVGRLDAAATSFVLLANASSAVGGTFHLRPPSEIHRNGSDTPSLTTQALPNVQRIPEPNSLLRALVLAMGVSRIPRLFR